MYTITDRVTKRSAAAIAVVALAVPATSAARPAENIETKAAASHVQQQEEQRGVDLRSPDATNAPQIGAQQETRGSTDLRSADAKDSNAMAESPAPVEIVEAPSFHWDDAGIGAGSALGLLLITLSVAFAVIHRRDRGVEGSSGPAVTT